MLRFHGSSLGKFTGAVTFSCGFMSVKHVMGVLAFDFVMSFLLSV